MSLSLIVRPGAGGVDSQDWARLMKRMYVRWAERHGLTARVTKRGVRIKGDAEELRAESGVHRFVRYSPFDPQHRRHTSFVMVGIRELIPDPAVPDEALEGQVRSYVLDPYQCVTDHRTGAMTDDVAAVLDGDFSGLNQ